MKMINAVRKGRDSCSDLSWVFRLVRIGPRTSGVVATGGSWVAVVVVAGDSCVCMRLSGVALDVIQPNVLDKAMNLPNVN